MRWRWMHLQLSHRRMRTAPVSAARQRTRLGGLPKGHRSNGGEGLKSITANLGGGWPRKLLRCGGVNLTKERFMNKSKLHPALVAVYLTAVLASAAFADTSVTLAIQPSQTVVLPHPSLKQRLLANSSLARRRNSKGVCIKWRLIAWRISQLMMWWIHPMTLPTWRIMMLNLLRRRFPMGILVTTTMMIHPWYWLPWLFKVCR